MNTNEIEAVWNSPYNNPPTDEQQQLAVQFARQMIRRRRFQRVWLVNTFVWLTLITGMGIWTIVNGTTTPVREYGLFPLLLVPWGFAIHFLRRHLKPVAPAVRGEVAIVDSFRAALASNQEARRHLKLIGVLYLIMIPLLAFVMRQLHEVGKVSDRELTSMALFFGTALLLGAAGITIRYFARLQPQQKRLNELLGQLTA